MAGLCRLSEVQRRELTEAFKHFDKNSDGKICATELLQVMRDFSEDIRQTDVDEVMEKADVDKNEFIDLEEILQMNAECAANGEEKAHLQASFNAFDADKDGQISPDELHKLMSRIGEKVTLQDCKDMIFYVDSNGDGKVDFDDFVVMMHGA